MYEINNRKFIIKQNVCNISYKRQYLTIKGTKKKTLIQKSRAHKLSLKKKKKKKTFNSFFSPKFSPPSHLHRNAPVSSLSHACARAPSPWQ